MGSRGQNEGVSSTAFFPEALVSSVLLTSFRSLAKQLLTGVGLRSTFPGCQQSQSLLLELAHIPYLAFHVTPSAAVERVLLML